MAIESDISAPLTLEVSGNAVTPERFLRAVQSFFALAKSVTENVQDDANPVNWTVQVKAGSNLVELIPAGDAPQSVIDEIASQLAFGTATLEREASEVHAFDDLAMRAVRTMGRVAEDGGDNILVRIWAAKQPCPITQRSAANVTVVISGDFEEHGAVEGFIRTISDDGGFRIVIKEPLWGNVRCHIDANILPDALKMFGKRVEVYGTVKYTREGRAKSVRVEEIIPFPETQLLPTAESVRGILGHAA